MQKKKLLNTRLSVGHYSDFIQEMILLAQQKKSSYVCVSNVHMLIEAHYDNNFSRIINNADIATPDGMPLAKCMDVIYGTKQDRVAGMDIMPSLMKEAASNSMSVYLYGSTEKILDLIVAKSQIEFPGLKIAGSYAPPFRILTQEEKQEIIEKINATNPDFVFVALGCPKQEKWMAEHKNRVNSCMLGLGGAFSVFAGVQKRAPKWMQNTGLEWVYRFYQEPKRLWKRYLVTNTLFSLLMIQFIVKRLIRLCNYHIKKNFSSKASKKTIKYSKTNHQHILSLFLLFYI